MRKSQTKTGARPFWAAATAVLGAAAAVTAVASPAWAATLTTTPTQVPTQGGLVLSVASTGLTNANNGYTARFVGGTNPTCGTAVPTVNANATNPVYDAGTVTWVSSTALTIATAPVPVGSYKLCAYEDVSSTITVHSTTGTVLAVPFASLSSVTGVAGGGNNITLTATGAFTGTTFGVEFSKTACADKYTTPATTNIIAASGNRTGNNTMTVTVPTSVDPAAGYYVCVYNGTAANTSTIVSRSWVTYGAYANTLASTTVTPANGSSGIASTITLNAASGTFDLTKTFGAIATRNSCPSTMIASSVTTLNQEQYKITDVTPITSSKVAVIVPATVVAGPRDATTPWNVCVYDNTSTAGVLVSAPAAYIVAPPLSLAGVNNSTGGTSVDPSLVNATASVVPASGPAQGGTTIKINNLQGIPTAEGALLTVSLGGSPLRDVKAVDATSITGVTSAHAPGRVNLTITTAAGTKSTLYNTATYGVFNYDYAINVTPNSAKTNTVPVLDIFGAGFSSLSFAPDISTTGIVAADQTANTTAGTVARVLLTDNAWNNQSFSGSVKPFTSSLNPIAQCGTPLVIGDNELICKLDLKQKIAYTGSPDTWKVTTSNDTTSVVPNGTYTVTVVNDESADLKPALYNFSIVTSGSTFTVAPF